MDASAPQLPSPLLLQLSNTASNEARRHWLLEKRLTAPLPDAADGPPGGADAPLSEEVCTRKQRRFDGARRGGSTLRRLHALCCSVAAATRRPLCAACEAPSGLERR
jgi:hypothetical protein